MKTIRRLVVCLDGTWNNRDDSTNVLAHFSLTCETSAKVSAETVVTQERFYQTGVGTGPLDYLTGGGFGFGLEEHVREAYDWLVQHFEDADPARDKEADEIYIFGFSRGAYTARSLVGFIGTCGLLRRGAPLTVNQLWEDYGILGLEREEHGGGLARKVFGSPVPTFRRITDLVWDPWHVDPSKPSPPDTVPGQRVRDLSPTETLLVRWSRRVKITYLGVYDTVGAMGWDALAIPGLRSKMAVHHNMRPTTIIQKCRHALAMDEHRSSFVHTPFIAYIGEKTGAGEMERSGISSAVSPADARLKMRPEKWQLVEKMWQRRIEQRWFVGAHSNIGGGYPDNLLAQRPLQWLLEGARAAGLLCENFSPAPPPTRAQTLPRDSFAEFAAPLWTVVFRAKRNYRTIDPKPELRANRDEAKNPGEPRAGFSLVSIHERVDDSVLDYWKGSTCPPANLVGYARREQTAPAQAIADWQVLAGQRPLNPWPGSGWAPQVALVLWATLASAGLAVTDRIFGVWSPGSPPLWLFCLMAAIFPLVDWAESTVNSSLASGGAKPWKLAFLDSIYWTRALGVVLCVFGALGSLANWFSLGWQASSFTMTAILASPVIIQFGLVATCAAAGATLANGFNRRRPARLWPEGLGLLSGPFLVMLAVFVVAFVVHGLGHVARAALGLHSSVQPAVAVQGARLAGLLLLLQLGLGYLTRAFTWVEEPLNKANLGSITELQKPATPQGIQGCLNRWCKMLGDHHDPQAAECGMTAILRQALWRDVFGFIPVYSLVLGFGFWFAAFQLGWQAHWDAFGILWWVIPLVTAVMDYLENACHFHYIALHEKRAMPNGLLTRLSFAATWVKNIGFSIQSVVTIVALFWISYEIAKRPQDYGWRGLIGLAVTTGTTLTIVGLWIWGQIYQLMNRHAVPAR